MWLGNQENYGVKERRTSENKYKINGINMVFFFFGSSKTLYIVCPMFWQLFNKYVGFFLSANDLVVVLRYYKPLN